MTQLMAALRAFLTSDKVADTIRGIGAALDPLPSPPARLFREIDAGSARTDWAALRRDTEKVIGMKVGVSLHMEITGVKRDNLGNIIFLMRKNAHQKQGSEKGRIVNRSHRAGGKFSIKFRGGCLKIDINNR